MKVYIKRAFLIIILIPIFISAQTDSRKKITVIFSTGNEIEINLINDTIETYNQLQDRVEVRLISHKWNSPDPLFTFMKFFTLDESAIDIIYSDTAWIPIFVHYDWLLPLDEYLDGRDEIFAPDAVNNARYNSNVYALPYNLKGNLMYYRKDILEKYNLEPAKSFIDLRRQVQLVKESEDIEHGLVYHTRFFYNDILPMIWANGGAIVDSNSNLTVNSQENRELLKQFKSLITDDKNYTLTTEEFAETQELGYDWPLDEFVQGKALYMINWSNRWNKIHLNGDMKGKVGVAPILTLRGNSSQSNYGGWYLTVNKNTKYPKESVDFLLYLLNEENQRARFRELSELPSLTSLYDSDKFMKNPDNVPLKSMYDILSKTRARIPVASGNEIGKIIDTYFTRMMTDEMSVNDALSKAEADIEQVFNRFQKRSNYETKAVPISPEALNDYSNIPLFVLLFIWLAAGITVLIYRKQADRIHSLIYKITFLGIGTTILSIVTGSCLLISMNMKVQHDDLVETVNFHNQQISDYSSIISKKIALSISSLLESENTQLTSLKDVTLPDSLADLMAVAYFDRDVEGVQVIDLDGNIIVSDQTYLYDSSFVDRADRDLDEAIRRVQNIRTISARLLPDNGGYEVLAPIYIKGTYFGAVRYIFTLEQLHQHLDLIRSKYEAVVLRSVIITSILIIVLATTALIIYIRFSTSITKPITNLTEKAEYINNASFAENSALSAEEKNKSTSISSVLNNIAKLKEEAEKSGLTESGTLASAFAKLAANLSKSFDIIERQKGDLENYRDHLEQMVEEKTNEIQQKNIEIMDSILYARVIQSTILPKTEQMHPAIKEKFFALWKPRDIVGGDFYWYSQSGESLILALGDCTGHGVPGALMTMTATSALHAIVDEEPDTASEIISKLDISIRDTLNKYSSEEVDMTGLDIGIIMVDLNDKHMQFSGASIDLLITGPNGIEKFEGTNRGVGYCRRKSNKHFRNHTFVPSEGETIFLSSDGYLHQTGGEKQFCFGKSRFRNTIQNYRFMKPHDIQTELLREFDLYRGETPQLDDLTVIGFRV
jgi:ABC-type glycerol-3-phosphate transport system substrate-binding protein/serine phosphatase RsbU (regulator of sigma subunit)